MKRLLSTLALLASSLTAYPTATYGLCKEKSSGSHTLKIEESEIEINGRTSKVYQLVPSDGSKYLKMREGGCFNLNLSNQISQPSTVHWHGLILPVLEDGVAYVTQAPILPGKSQLYNFQIVQDGTYFAHAHYGLQEQKLMAIPLIILPQKDLPHRDIVLYFEDFSFRSPKEIWQGLRKDYVQERKLKGRGWKPTLNMPVKSKYSPHHLNDVKYDAFLTNRKPPTAPESFKVSPGETVRLRIINAACATNFMVDVGHLNPQIVAVDGQEISPVALGNFPLAVAQRIDVLVEIPEIGGEFPIVAQGEGTDMLTGIILTTNKTPPKPLPAKNKTTISAVSNMIEREFHAKYPLQPRKVDRRLTATLEGDMQYFTWAINNHVWPLDKPLMVKKGERVELTIRNRTGMSHPMHLHGHTFLVTEIDDSPIDGAMRDTILVMPGQTIRVQFDANNPGVWAFHCHILYHAWGGMFTVVQYEDYTPPYFPQKTIDRYSQMYGGY